jgi:hypothetical protein
MPAGVETPFFGENCVVMVFRAWTKESLGEKLGKQLNAYTREEIISVRVGVDFQYFWPARRNWAMVIVKGTPTQTTAQG